MNSTESNKVARVDYITMLWVQDSIVGKNGLPVSPDNLPSFKAGDIQQHVFERVVPCCENFSKLFNQGIIGFGTRPESTYHNHSIDIYFRAENTKEPIVENVYERVYNKVLNPFHGKDHLDIPIPYCPFCRAPIISNELFVLDERPVDQSRK